MIYQSIIKRVMAVLRESYGYKVTYNQTGTYSSELTIENNTNENIAIVNLLAATDMYQITYNSGYYQLSSSDKAKFDNLMLDFSANPVLGHLSNKVNLRSKISRNWGFHLSHSVLIDKKEGIYRDTYGYFQVDKHGYVTLLGKKIQY